MVGRTVEATRQIGGDDLDVLRGRLDEIDDRDLAIVSEVLFQSTVPHTSGIKCRVVPMFRCIVTCARTQYIAGGIDAACHTPEPLRSLTRRTELMTSLPISSNTRTFHTAPSAGVVASWVASSWASMSVTGAFRFSMRLMLATCRPVSCIQDIGGGPGYLFACPAM
jgi:hypothetical protein